MKRKNKIRILSIALIGIMLSILPMTILTAYAAEPRAAAAPMTDELGNVELLADTSEGDLSIEDIIKKQGYELLTSSNYDPDKYYTLIYNNETTPKYINETETKIQLIEFELNDTYQQEDYTNYNAITATITTNYLISENNPEINDKTLYDTNEWNAANTTLIIGPIKITYYNQNIEWNNYIYAKEYKKPEGYRLATKEDIGKVIKNIFIDINAIPKYINNENEAKILISIADEDDIVRWQAQTQNNIINHLFFPIYNNTTTPGRYEEGVIITELITNEIKGTNNDLGIITEFYAEEEWNNWLYVKDIEPPAATIPGEEMKPVLTSLISLMVAGITALAGGIGSGLTNLVTGIFLATENGEIVGLSTFGAVIIIFAGVSLAISLSRWVVNYITSLGN